VSDLSAAPTSVPDGNVLERARAALTDRIDNCRKGLGGVAAIVEPSGTRFVCYGRAARDLSRALDEHTGFELGCIVKVFDALLLADMVERREVELWDPIERYLPPDVRVPRRGPAITLLHLVTHTSGLPGRLTSLAAEESTHTPAGLYQFLSTFELPRDAGAYYEYSNTGARLLRHVLERRLSAPFDVLLRERVCAPLGLEGSVLGVTPATEARMAVGHNDRLEPVPNDPLEFRSTAADLARLLEASLNLRPSPLSRAFVHMLSVRQPSGPNVDAALGWNIESHTGDEILCHEGVSWGFRGWIGYRPSIRRGIVLLANAAAAGGIQDMGYHLLDERYPLLGSDFPLMRPAPVPIETSVGEEVLERHVGRYQLTPNVMIEVRREGGQLVAHKTGRRSVAIFPESPTVFFCKQVDFFELPADTRLTFRPGDDGTTAGLTLHQRGQDVWLPRVAAGGGRVWFGHVPVALPAERLQPFVGRYRLGASLMAVDLSGGRLTARFGEGLPVELVPASETEFFLVNDEIHTTIRFELDGVGRPAELVCTNNGFATRGVRLD
jgi:CubicO group peptidase (beta-lactamase class C family)